MLSEDIADIIALAKVAQILNHVNLPKRYNKVMSNADLDVAKE